MLNESASSQLIDELESELAGEPSPTATDDFELLRKILFGEYREQIRQLQGDLDNLSVLLDNVEQQLNDDDRLARTIAPIIAPAITSSIRESREAMIEALYPIIGQMVVRAVTEAMRDLARRIDHQMRRTLSVQTLAQQFQAMVRGVPEGEMALRSSLPFHVQEVFLIHRENGLLLNHISRHPELSADSDLISGMLTAIRDFAADAFGRNQEGQLNQIEYGDKVILLEATQHAYIAVVMEGVEPTGFRANMREQAIDIEHAYATTLRNWDGDSAAFTETSTHLHKLISIDEVQPKPAKSPTSPSVLPNPSLDVLFMIIIAIIAALLFGILLWQWRAASGPAY